MIHSEYIPVDHVVMKRKRNSSTRTSRSKRLVVTGSMEIKEWLHGFMKKHWYFHVCPERNRLMIAFHDKQDAILFKLTWIGR